jgi:hypothetical protein
VGWCVPLSGRQSLVSQISEFQACVTQFQLGDPALLPDALVQAAAEVLGVDGAGLSLTDEGLRVPLAASNPDVATAESLQTTLGEGPCLPAEAGQQQVSDSQAVNTTWPVFGDLLVARTPFRSAMSVPLLLSLFDDHILGAMDLYSTQPDGQPLSDCFTSAAAVAGAAAHSLLASADAGAPSGSPFVIDAFPWLTTPSAQQRMQAWMAVGMLRARTGLSASDALAALRAHAFSHDLTIDEVTDRVLGRHLDVTEFG